MTATDKQIRQLRTEAMNHGDALMAILCDVALGRIYSAAELNDDSCLTPRECRQVLATSAAAARAECESAIADASAQEG